MENKTCLICFNKSNPIFTLNVDSDLPGADQHFHLDLCKDCSLEIARSLRGVKATISGMCFNKSLRKAKFE